MILFHPSLLIIIATLVFALIEEKKNKFFQLVTLLSPVVSYLLILLCGIGTGNYELYNFEISWQYNQISELMAPVILLIILVSNEYAIKKSKYKELIFGSIYGAFALFTILSNDLISMFVGIEIMMIASSFIIFIGNKSKSKNSAKKYFLTHSISSGMILIGIVHIIAQTGSVNIINVTELIDDPLYSNYIFYIMFAGMVINIAVPPFSGWMVNYYKQASSAGFLYLINFTTKVSIILLIKIFAGFELLKYIGIVMILYAGFKAIFEDHIISLLCYLSIIAMGVMVIAIGFNVILPVILYLVIHIAYKFLLSLSVVNMFSNQEDNKSFYSEQKNAKLFLCSRLGQVKSKILITSLIVAVVLMINIPFSLSYYTKIQISHLIDNSIFYWLILLANLLMVIALPWRQFYQKAQNKIVLVNKTSLFGLTIFIVFCGFLFFFSPVLQEQTSSFNRAYNFDIIKQFLLLTIGFAVVYFVKINKKISRGINFVVTILNIFVYINNKILQGKEDEKNKEDWNFNSFESQLMDKISNFHNQQTAIFGAFLFFIVMLLTLLIVNN